MKVILLILGYFLMAVGIVWFIYSTINGRRERKRSQEEKHRRLAEMERLIKEDNPTNPGLTYFMLEVLKSLHEISFGIRGLREQHGQHFALLLFVVGQIFVLLVM